MAKTTKTTRNKNFNYYSENKNGAIYANSVASMSTTKDISNIRLLDVNSAVIVKGAQIVADSSNNTTLIEANTGLSSDVAKIVAQFAISGEPEDAGLKKIYNKLKELLDDNMTSYDKVKTMVIDTGIPASDAENKYYIFGAPFQAVLNNRQNYNNCGAESTLNTLAAAGIIKMKENLKDQKSTEKSFLNKLLIRGLVDDSGKIGKLDEADGGTLPNDYRDIFALYDIDSESYYLKNYKNSSNAKQYDNLNELAYKVSQGYGAVIGVCSSKLWKETKSESGEIEVDHAIAIVGVVYDTETPDTTTTPVGFYIHDTGCWMTRFITLNEFKDVTLYDYIYASESDLDNKKLSTLSDRDDDTNELYTKDSAGIYVTITKEPIKTNMYNLNATGDKRANIIYGNSASNQINGKDGDDILYGGNGNDTIFGGKGNDIIFGCGVTESDITEFKKYVNTDKLDDIDTFDASLGGVNTLYGNSGNDIIFGGNGSDLIYGGDGHDYIYGGDERDAIYGGKGNDVIIGGVGNDRLSGDAGNDVIYGGNGSDTILGGLGNDVIYGGTGNDKIETGKGADTVYIEGKEHGIDEIFSQGGSVKIKFIKDGVDDAAVIKDINISLKKDEDSSNKYDVDLYYVKNEDDSTNGISINEFYNKKKNTCKNVTLADLEKTYKLSVSKSKKVTVANTSMNKKNADINNILLSAYTKGATITTSKKDDIVYMLESENESDESYKTAIDKITYTGGNDKYVSKERNTYYTVSSFNQYTNLSIYDNIDALKKIELNLDYDPTDSSSEPVIEKRVVSGDDKLYINSSKDNLVLFFDVDTNKKTTNSNALCIFDKSSLNDNKFVSAAKGEETSGRILIDSFFNNNKDFGDAELYSIYGNGRIEEVYCNNTKYDDFESNIATIASSVANWLGSSSNTGHYTSAFAAIENGGDEISTLIQCYTVNA